jgi:hypothetical protein
MVVLSSLYHHHQNNNNNNAPLPVKILGVSAAIIFRVVDVVLALFALYLYFKCNYAKGTKSSLSDKVLGFLGACCCHMCYIAYHLAVPC